MWSLGGLLLPFPRPGKRSFGQFDKGVPCNLDIFIILVNIILLQEREYLLEL